MITFFLYTGLGCSGAIGSGVPVLVKATEQPLMISARVGMATIFAVCDENFLIMLDTPFLMLSLSTARERSLGLSLPSHFVYMIAEARMLRYIKFIDKFLVFFTRLASILHFYCERNPS